MNKDEKTLVIVAVGVTVILLIGLNLHLVDLSDVYFGVFFSALASFGYIGYQRKWFEDKLGKFQNTDDNSGYKDDWSTDEALDFVKEWSKDNYGSDDWIEFHWDNAQDAVVRVSSGLDGVDQEKLYAVWTDHGPKHQGVQIFVNCTTKEKLSHLKLKFEEQRVKPFLFCDYFLEARRNARRGTGMEEGSRNPTLQLGGVSGVSQSSLTPIDAQDESSEDEDNE